MNKKLGNLLLAMLLGFAACGNDGREAGNNDTEPTKFAGGKGCGGIRTMYRNRSYEKSRCGADCSYLY